MSYPVRLHNTIKGHNGPVHFVTYNTSGEYCLSGGQDKIIRLWNAVSGMHIKSYNAHGREVLGISVAHDNSRFASCGSDRQVIVWDVATGMTIRRFSGHLQRVNCVGFNRDASVVFSGSFDTTVRIWDCRSNTRTPIQIIEEAKDSIMSLQVSDFEFVTGSTDGCIRTYDLRMGRLNEDLIGHAVTSVRLSGDGNCVLVSSLDARIRLIDKENGSMLNEFKGHKNSEYKIQAVLTKADTHVLSGSEDGGIYIWDLVEGNLISTLRGHEGMVSSIDYHPQEVGLVSAGVDGTIRIWGE